VAAKSMMEFRFAAALTAAASTLSELGQTASSVNARPSFWRSWMFFWMIERIDCII
jgi:hypothetical protein